MADNIPIVTSEHIRTLLMIPLGTRLRLKALNHATGSYVFIKILDTSGLSDRDLGEILQDVEIMHRIKHERVMQIVGIYRTPGLFGILTEWMPNGSLESLIHQQDVYPVLSPCVCIRILTDIAEGLCHLHSLSPPVMHQSLKPCNILLDQQYRAKLTDFGLLRQQKVSAIISASTDQNARVYLSPERLQGANPTIADNVYSFGIITWELLCRKRPFQDKDKCLKLETYITMGHRPQPNVDAFLKPDDIDPTLTTSLVQLIHHCWHENPLMRPQMTECYFLLCNILQKFPKQQIDSSVCSLVRHKERADQANRCELMEIDIRSVAISCHMRDSKASLRNRSQSTPEAGQPPQHTKEQRSASLPAASPMHSLKSSNYTPHTANGRFGTTQRQEGSSPARHSHATKVSWLPVGANPLMPSEGVLWNSSACLIKYRERILHSITEGRLNHLLDTIVSRSLFCRDEYEKIKSKATVMDQARACLDIAHEKGEEVASLVLETLGFNGFTNGYRRNPA